MTTNALVPNGSPARDLTLVRDDEARQTPTLNALVPSSLTEAMKLAELMSRARLVPQHLQAQPADCLLVIEQASRWGLSPFAVAQSTSVIQGKLMFEGKLVAAVVNARGELADRLSYEYAGEGDNRTVRVSGRMRGETEPRTVEVRLGDAKTNNKVWATQPDQQLMYHGARVWARRHMPELMLGVYSREEFNEQVEEQRQERRQQRQEAPQGPSADVAPSASDEPPKASPGQVRALNIAMGGIIDAIKAAAGVQDERAAKLMWLSAMVGREVSSSKDLLADEIGRLIDAAKAGEMPA